MKLLWRQVLTRARRNHKLTLSWGQVERNNLLGDFTA